MSIFETWPHLYFIWKESFEEVADCPTLADVVDVNWTPEDLLQIIAYLEKCPVSLVSPFGNADVCSQCGKQVSAFQSQHSDGTWVWFARLPHYVREHHVRLPDRLVEHIRRNNYTVPVL